MFYSLQYFRPLLLLHCVRRPSESTKNAVRQFRRINDSIKHFKHAASIESRKEKLNIKWKMCARCVLNFGLGSEHDN